MAYIWYMNRSEKSIFDGTHGTHDTCLSGWFSNGSVRDVWYVNVGPMDVVRVECMMKLVCGAIERSVRHANPPFQEDHTTVPCGKTSELI
jgi:hypothetical protein